MTTPEFVAFAETAVHPVRPAPERRPEPFRRRQRRAELALGVLLLAACGDGAPPVDPGPPPTPQFLSVSPDSLRLTHFGETARVRASIRPEPPGTAVKWSSTDSSVVVVDADGVVTAVANGEAGVVGEVGPLRDTVGVLVWQVIGALELVGDGQRAGAGRPLRERVGIRMLDAGGSLIVRARLRVRFDASADGGRADPAEVRAMADEARTEWTLGPGAGPQTLAVRVAGWSVEIGAMALEPDSMVAALALHSGGGQAVPAGEVLDEPVAVAVLDTVGQRVPGARVRFEPLTGHGSVEPAETLSDSAGLAWTRWTLGDAVGAQTLVARSGLAAGLEIGATARSREGVCARTPEVAEEIVKAVGAASCAEVTEADLGRIGVMDLSRRGIRKLRSGDFAGLSRIRQIRLSSNEFEEVPPDIFVGLHRLEFLGLGYGRLSALPPGLFADLPSLDYLVIARSGLAELPPGIFAGLGNLRDLRLQDNELSELPPRIFTELESLEQLFLHGNRLVALPEGVFAGLARLERLRIDKNRLTALPLDVFAGLTSLRELRIGQNSLSALPAGVFADLAGLRMLWLHHNRLEALPPGIFAGLHNLEEFHATANPGSPFPLPVEFERTDADDLLAEGPARMVMRVPAGAPLDFRMPVSVQRGEASVAWFDVSAGDTVSAEVVVLRPPGSARAVHLSFGQPPGLPSTYTGLAVVPGGQIALFAAADNRTPEFREPLPAYWMQAGGAEVGLELEPYFDDLDGDSLVYGVEASDERVAAGRIEGGALWMEPRGEGEAVLELTAADPGGLMASQRLALQVAAAPDPDRFDIEVVFGPGFTERHREVVWQAVERWEEVLVGDQPDVPVDGYLEGCGEGGLRLVGTIDDLVIVMHSNTIGLPYLAFAGRCGQREQPALIFHGGNWYGSHFFEPEYSIGSVFHETVLHEIGHVVGIGLGRGWSQFARWSGDDATDPHYAGPLAIAAFDEAGGKEYRGNKVPLYDRFHWGRPMMVSDIMVGGLGGGNALSAITLQALADQGHVVDLSKADSLRVALPGQTVAGAPAEVAGEDAREFSDIIIDLPVVVVDSAGRVVRIIRN